MLEGVSRPGFGDTRWSELFLAQLSRRNVRSMNNSMTEQHDVRAIKGRIRFKKKKMEYEMQ